MDNSGASFPCFDTGHLTADLKTTCMRVRDAWARLRVDTTRIREKPVDVADGERHPSKTHHRRVMVVFVGGKLQRLFLLRRVPFKGGWFSWHKVV